AGHGKKQVVHPPAACLSAFAARFGLRSKEAQARVVDVEIKFGPEDFVDRALGADVLPFQEPGNSAPREETVRLRPDPRVDDVVNRVGSVLPMGFPELEEALGGGEEPPGGAQR